MNNMDYSLNRHQVLEFLKYLESEREKAFIKGKEMQNKDPLFAQAMMDRNLALCDVQLKFESILK